MRYILPYINHFKSKKENLLNGLVLDWPSWWRENEKDDDVDIINQMNTDPLFESYYSNCISFFKASSRSREVIWNIAMIFQDIHELSELCAMGSNISDDLKILKRQGIEMFKSQKLLDFVRDILEKKDNERLSKEDREVLGNLLEGYILVDDKLISLN
jgi:hypothetical protein